MDVPPGLPPLPHVLALLAPSVLPLVSAALLAERLVERLAA